MCKIGYLRSSYNGSGFNSVIDTLLGKKGFYYIFEAGDDYEFQPDWEASRERAEQLLKEYDAAVEGDGLLRSFFVGPNMFEKPGDLKARCSSESDAVNIVKEVMESNKDRTPEFRSFGNIKGEFFLDGLTILATVPGMSTFKQQGVYLVYRDEKSDDWYREAIQITIEMCDWVLARKDIDKFYLAWSA